MVSKGSQRAAEIDVRPVSDHTALINWFLERNDGRRTQVVVEAIEWWCESNLWTDLGQCLKLTLLWWGEPNSVFSFQSKTNKYQIDDSPVFLIKTTWRCHRNRANANDRHLPLVKSNVSFWWYMDDRCLSPFNLSFSSSLSHFPDEANSSQTYDDCDLMDARRRLTIFISRLHQFFQRRIWVPPSMLFTSVRMFDTYVKHGKSIRIISISISCFRMEGDYGISTSIQWHPRGLRAQIDNSRHRIVSQICENFDAFCLISTISIDSSVIEPMKHFLLKSFNHSPYFVQSLPRLNWRRYKILFWRKIWKFGLSISRQKNAGDARWMTIDEYFAYFQGQSRIELQQNDFLDEIQRKITFKTENSLKKNIR